MLRRLLVDNLTVVDRAELDLDDRVLIVLTGETGAGKTMIVQGLELILGQKADPRIVGPSGEEAYVEAEFEGPAPAPLDELAPEDEPLLLARRVRKQGQSRALCGGRGCSAETLKTCAEQLISLTGQHAARRLVDAGVQLSLLDEAGKLDRQVEAVADAYEGWRQATAALKYLQAEVAEGQERIDLLRHRVEQVTALGLQADEDRSLTAERDRLAHAESLSRSTQTAAAILSDENGVCDSLGRAVTEFQAAGAHDPKMSELAAEAEDCFERLQDLAREASRLIESYRSDPARLDEIEGRLAAIGDIRRLYHGKEITDILSEVEATEMKLRNIEGSEERLAQLAEAERQANETYQKVARQLRQARRRAARTLARSAEQHLGDLGLTGAKFEVEFEEAPASVRGIDRVRFTLQANAGLAPAPLDAGASGGEISRVNLALLLACAPDRGTYVFDEVDAGIGGRTAHALAAKLAELAQDSQVIVITHLAQIAVKADQHFLVQKTETDGRARTTVVALEDQAGRELELARLLGAEDKHSRQAAELLQSAAR